MAYYILTKSTTNKSKEVVSGSESKEKLCDLMVKQMKDLTSRIEVYEGVHVATADFEFFNGVQKMCYYTVKDKEGIEYLLEIEEIAWV